MKHTKTRQRVLDFLTQESQAFTPYEIAKKISMNAVTVYRVLDFLKEQKLVHHIPTLSKWSACQCLSSRQDHGFLICRKCDKIEEFVTPHACSHHHEFICEEHITEII